MKSAEWDKREKELDKFLIPSDYIKKKMTDQLLQAEKIIQKLHNYHVEFHVHGSLTGLRQINCNQCSWNWKKSWWKFW